MKIKHLLITSIITLFALTSFAAEKYFIAYMYQNDDGETAAITLTKQNDVIIAVFKAGNNQDVIEVDEKTFSKIANQLDSINLDEFSTMGSKGKMDASSNHIILTKEAGGDGQKIGMYQIPKKKAGTALKKWISALKKLNDKK